MLCLGNSAVKRFSKLKTAHRRVGGCSLSIPLGEGLAEFMREDFSKSFRPAGAMKFEYRSLKLPFHCSEYKRPTGSTCFLKGNKNQILRLTSR